MAGPGQGYPAGCRTQISVLQIMGSLHQATLSPWSSSQKQRDFRDIKLNWIGKAEKLKRMMKKDHAHRLREGGPSGLAVREFLSVLLSTLKADLQ